MLRWSRNFTQWGRKSSAGVWLTFAIVWQSDSRILRLPRGVSASRSIRTQRPSSRLCCRRDWCGSASPLCWGSLRCLYWCWLSVPRFLASAGRWGRSCCARSEAVSNFSCWRLRSFSGVFLPPFLGLRTSFRFWRGWAKLPKSITFRFSTSSS